MISSVIQILLTNKTDLELICLLNTTGDIGHVFIYRAYALEAEPNDWMHQIEIIIMKKNKEVKLPTLVNVPAC